MLKTSAADAAISAVKGVVINVMHRKRYILVGTIVKHQSLANKNYAVANKTAEIKKNKTKYCMLFRHYFHYLSFT